MSLDEDEKKRIREEEFYRQEIRAELAKAKPSLTVWDYVNSPIALWLFSTVVVGLITLVYTNHQDSVKKEEAQKDYSRKLEAEINNRQKETLKFLAYCKDKTKEVLKKFDYNDPRYIYYETVHFMNGMNDPELLAFQPALYKEFKDQRLAALLVELKTASETKAEDITSLQTKYDAIEKLYSETPDRNIKGCPTECPTEDHRKRNIEAVDKVIEIINSK